MYPTANTNAVTQTSRHREKKAQPDPSDRDPNPTKNETNIDSDTLAEWLRRRPAKPMGSPRVGSNPTGVALPIANVIAIALPKRKGYLHDHKQRQRKAAHKTMTPVGFEPTQLALVELESTPLDHSGKVS